MSKCKWIAVYRFGFTFARVPSNVTDSPRRSWRPFCTTCPTSIAMHALVAQHFRDEHGLSLTAEQPDIAGAGRDGRPQAVGVELVPARRDDDERVPAGIEPDDRRGDVVLDHVDVREA